MNTPTTAAIKLEATPETVALAKNLIWFEAPEQALRAPIRFLAYAFARANSAEMALLESLLTKAQLQYALTHAPPGIIDPRSWAYWHLMLDLGEAPAMPERQFL